MVRHTEGYQTILDTVWLIQLHKARPSSPVFCLEHTSWPIISPVSTAAERNVWFGHWLMWINHSSLSTGRGKISGKRWGVNVIILRDFPFSQRCSWRGKSFGMLRRFDCPIITDTSEDLDLWQQRCDDFRSRTVATDVSEKRTAPFLSAWQSKRSVVTCRLGNTLLRNVHNYLPGSTA